MPRALRTAIESRGAGDDWGFLFLFFRSTSIFFQPRSRSGVGSGSFFSFVSACIAGSWRWFIFMAGSPKKKSSALHFH